MSNYNENSISELSQIEGARLRPQSIGFESESHIFTEQLANSIDEAREGFGNLIEVEKYEDNSISVRDYGRSIPLDYNEKTNKYNWESIFLKMWAGGKYDNSVSGANYKLSLGTNGAGNFGSATTSEFLEVFSYKGEECHNIRFEKGRVIKEFNKYPCNVQRGTKTYFKPDIEVYGENVITDDFIEEMLKRQSIVNGGIKFIYRNNKNKYKKEFYYENGISDYIREVSNNKEISDFYKFEGKTFIKSKPQDFEAQYSIDFAFNNSNNLMEYYHNASYLPNGGLPEKVIKNSMLYVFDKLLSSNNLYKKGEKIKFEDIQDSLIIIFSSGSTTSIFADQTKKSIGHKDLQNHITDEFKTYLEILFTEESILCNKILNQILTNMRARTTSENTKLNIKKKLSEKVDGINNRVDGLVDCKIHGEEAELYITEGLSALGGCIQSRNPINQAGIAIRGKILNCLKAPYSKIFNSEIIENLVKVIGCGIECDKKNKDFGEFNINNLKYGKIIFLVDEDADAKSISCLLLTMFYRLMPQLLREGRIYIAQTPLFEIKNLETDEVFYANSEKERDEIASKIKKVKVGRNKGIGEVEFSVLHETAMNPKTRNLMQIKINNEKEMIKMFEKWMDEEVTERKLHIESHLDKYIGFVE